VTLLLVALDQTELRRLGAAPGADVALMIDGSPAGLAFTDEEPVQAWRNAEALVNAPTPAARALVEAEIERVAAVEADLLVVATSYTSGNLPQILGELGSLGAQPSRTMQAQADRASNSMHNLLGNLFTPGATLRNQYCASHG
jgi:hypothetical protein